MDSSDGSAAALFLAIMGVQVISGIISFALFLWALIDALKVQSDTEYRAGSKVVWILVIVLIPCIGPIVYLAVGRPKRS